jgi:hypothetical protein
MQLGNFDASQRLCKVSRLGSKQINLEETFSAAEVV